MKKVTLKIFFDSLIAFLFVYFIALSVTAKADISIKINEVDQIVPSTIREQLEKNPLCNTAFHSQQQTLFCGRAILKEFNEGGHYRNIMLKKYQAPDGLINWQLTAQAAVVVGDIAFTGITNQEQEMLRQFFQTRSGSEFDPDVLLRDLQKIQNWFSERGYLKAHVSQEIINKDNQVHIHMNIQKNTPCLIAEVRYSTGFNVLDLINAPIEPGSLCDKISLKDSLEKEENRLKSEGYIEAKVGLLGLDYTADKERAVARVLIQKGTRTRIEIINTQKSQSAVDLNFLKDGFSNAELAYLSGEELQRQIALGYQKLGYAKVLVAGPERINEPDGNRLLHFEVTPGPQIFLGKIQFKGDLPLSQEELLSRLNLKPGFFSARLPYVEERILEIPQNLKAILGEESYLDAEVAEPFVSFSPEGTIADVEVNVTRGNGHFLSALTQSGLPSELRKRGNSLRDSLQLGARFSPSKLQSYMQQIRIELVQEGYTYAQVEAVDIKYQPSSDRKTNVSIYLKVSAGPLVKIGQIVPEGELFGKGTRLVKESALNPGDIYKPAILERARQRILQHGLFGSVEISPLNKDQVDKKNGVIDLVIRVRARPAYQLSLGPGWGSLKGYRFGIDYTRNNITKEGTRFFTSVTLSQEKEQTTSTGTEQLLGRQISAGLVSPFLQVGKYVTPFDESVSASWGAVVQPLYNRLFRSAQVEMIWHPLIFDFSFDISGKLSAENSELIGSNLPVLEALEYGKYLRAREFGGSVTLDTRNNREWPTLGTITELNYLGGRFGMQSDLQYDRYALESAWFTPVWGRLSFALAGGVTRIAHIDSKNAETVTVPGSRRASLNGKAIIRGFPESGIGLGPLIWLKKTPSTSCKNVLTPTGASNLLYTKSELRYRTPWLSDNIGVALFSDSGLSYFWKPEEAAIQRSLDSQSLDQAEVDGCKITQAALVGNTPIVQTGTGAIKEYFNNAYLSAGIGLRGIIPNFAALSFDWGIPIFDPASHRQTNCLTSSAAQISDTQPTCVVRLPESKMLGVIPGSFHISLGAHF